MTGPPPPLHVLLVEDNPADAAIVAGQLAAAGAGVELTAASSLAEALRCLGERTPDALLLDLSLGDSDGLDTYITIHARAPLVPVVVLSGRDEPDTVLDAVRLGAQDFLEKGKTTPALLLRALQFAVERSRLTRISERRRSTATLDRLHPAGDPPPGERLAPHLPVLPLERHAGHTASVATTGRFRLAAGLGSGGMCTVVQAHQVNLHRDVAVKFLRPELNDPRRIAQFQAEARVTAWLEHPNIVPVHDLGDTFFVMRRVPGLTLAQLIKRHPGQDELPFFAEILLKVCDAVAFAHSRGVIHRDIKPENIMVGQFGEVLLMDWGLALAILPPADGVPRAQPPPEDPHEICAGTIAFLPPEIAWADLPQVGYATDVFLLGATLYNVLTGRAPYDHVEGSQDALAAASFCRYRPVVDLAPAAPPTLIAITSRAMLRDGASRGTVQSFAAGLRTWLHSAG
jgi:CheY-like chemotaxis protein